MHMVYSLYLVVVLFVGQGGDRGVGRKWMEMVKQDYGCGSFGMDK